MKISHHTRHQRGDGMRNETMYAAGIRRPVRPGRRFLIVCSVLLIAGVGFIVYRLMSGPSSRPAEVPMAAASDVPVVPRQNVLLLEDPVCNKPVDPRKTRFVLKFNGQELYFDSEECMTKFLADPFKYGQLRLKVTVTRPDGTSTTVPVPAPSSVQPTAVPLEPTPAAQETGLPEGDAGLQLPPEPSPETAVSPVPGATGDAPSVNESYPGAAPTPDQPGVAPNGPAPGVPQVTAPTSKPDDNGFTLPPTVETGAPAQTQPATRPVVRKAPARPARPAAKPATKTAPPAQAPPSGDDPPSVDEPNNGM